MKGYTSTNGWTEGRFFEMTPHQLRLEAELARMMKERDEARAEANRLRAALEQIAFPRTIGSAFHEEAVAIARRVL